MKGENLGQWIDVTEREQELLTIAAERHFELLAADKCLKNDRKRCVSRLSVGGVSFIVKHFKKTPWVSWFSHARRTMKYTELMQGLTPPCLGMLHTKKRGELLFFHDCGLGNFYDWSYHEEPDLAGLYYACGSLLADVHNKQLYHADTKPANFVVNSRLPHLWHRVLLVDCDNVRKYRRLPMRLRIRNLAQFLGGTGYLGNQDRWELMNGQFFQGYRERITANGFDFDELLANVWDNVQHNPKIEVNLSRLSQENCSE